jgi:hypothetical protein
MDESLSPSNAPMARPLSMNTAHANHLRSIGKAAEPQPRRAAFASSDIAVLILAVVAFLIPFVAKPLNIDDPLFVWSAKQIQRHPWDFYGFDVNWYGLPQSMAVVNQNPPLVAYYLALVASVTGFHEVALHLAFLVPTMALMAGVYWIARRFCENPLLASLVAFFTPAMMVSATSLMCDVAMLALWCWAIVCWLNGLDTNRPAMFLLSGVLIGLSALAKYFGASLIPLLAAYTLLTRPRRAAWLACLLIPMAMLVAYELYARHLYGFGLLAEATAFSRDRRIRIGGGGLPQMGLAGVYLGGAFFTLLCYAPALWSWRTILLGAICTLGAAVGLCFAPSLLGFTLAQRDALRWHVPIHMALFAAAAVQIVGLCLADIWRRRDEGTLLLVLWVLGTFVFSAFFNWVVNVRSLLPMAPALGILALRRIEWRRPAWFHRDPWSLSAPGAAAALVAVAIAHGDFRLAVTAKEAAAIAYQRYAPHSDPLWFQGHWGFQYYMEELGAQRLRNVTVRTGQIVVIPLNNLPLHFFPPEAADRVDSVSLRASRFSTTLGTLYGVNFYFGSKKFGVVLPWAFMSVPPEPYFAFRFKRDAVLEDVGRLPGSL